METAAAASQRNTTVLGEVLGGGYAGEALGLLAIRDDGDGLARAIRQALGDAKLKPDDIGMIVAHGNGTPQSDASEAAAIRSIFGTGADAPPVTAFKWAIGHLIAAAGIIETVLALAALRRGIVPGIATVEIVRIERLLSGSPPDAPPRVFTAQELDDSGTGAGRIASLAARFAAKEACAKLFPRELALGQIEPEDFSVVRDAYGAPQVICNARAQSLLDRHRIRGLAVSLTHARSTASAVALALP